MPIANDIKCAAPRLLRRIVQTALRGAAFSFALAHSSTAVGAVADVGATGFTVHETVEIAAPPDKVYAALATPAQWWSSTHTFSGSAANLTLDARAGGCWCETLPNGGSVQHLIVVFAAPGKTLRLRGALGPFQGMGVDGALTWSLKPDRHGNGVDARLRARRLQQSRLRRLRQGGRRRAGRADHAPQGFHRNRFARRGETPVRGEMSCR